MSARAQARLAEIRAREAAATAGPWEAGRPDMATLVDGVLSKWVYAGDQYCAVASGRIKGEWPEVVANAVFIAHARQDIPALLAIADAAISGDPPRIAEAVRAFGEGA